MPFYPSPRKDDGYDITDFYGVDPRLGTLGDFVEFVRTARDRGIRVIVDLVVNHTSDQHPWFQAARADRDSPYRDFYVWEDEKPPEKPGDLVFPDEETSNWAWDEEAGQYYLHRFYSHQPDLNIANPEVRDEIAQVVGFWLELGLSGFRVDAVPFLLEPMGMPGGAMVDPHELLRDLRALHRPPQRRRDPARRGQPAARGPARRSSATRTATSCTCCSPSRSTRRCTSRSRARTPRRWRRRSRELPAIPADGAVGELRPQPRRADARQALEAEREEVFAAFGPEEDLQLFGRGLRRRLPPCSTATSGASAWSTA